MFITVIVTNIYFEVSNFWRNYSEIHFILQGIIGCFLLMFLLLDSKAFDLCPHHCIFSDLIFPSKHFP